MTPATRPPPPSAGVIQRDVERALAEDIGTGDASGALIDGNTIAHAHVLCREPAVLAGAPWFEGCLRALDPTLQIDWLQHDGDRIAADTVVCRLHGHARALLSGERSALNFLQTLSATATEAARYAAAVAGTRTRILDTRKTLPGLRQAQKYAVRCGGAHNHRMGLDDAILIKENHIAAAGGIAAAVARARQLYPQLLLEVEVENAAELQQALQAGVDRIMLDEFDDTALAAAVREVAGRVPLEVSGSVTLPRIATLAALGVDFISVGALTKNVRAIDLSMRLEATPG
ncbi:MAG TPA: carboxylating nicotinate-nucleotide diphosphorylase [Rhodanobacteraceae bacterium]|nr:carboxylating nicotinate-nucleotide diphosphorylase [Rhodanobacteraceae bacterium]